MVNHNVHCPRWSLPLFRAGSDPHLWTVRPGTSQFRVIDLASSTYNNRSLFQSPSEHCPSVRSTFNAFCGALWHPHLHISDIADAAVVGSADPDKLTPHESAPREFGQTRDASASTPQAEPG